MNPTITVPTANRRDVDAVFIRARRADGVPDAAIAKMGGWCIADVLAVPRIALIATEPQPVERAILIAADIPEVSEILCHVAEQYGVDIAEILGPSRLPHIVEPRHEAMAVAWELNRFTLRQLGEIFRKDDSAVLYGLRRHYERLRLARDWS